MTKRSQTPSSFKFKDEAEKARVLAFCRDEDLSLSQAVRRGLRMLMASKRARRAA